MESMVEKSEQNQSLTIADLLKLPVGTVLKKGNRRRVFMEIRGYMVFYKIPSRKRQVIGENAYLFEKWMKGAEIEKPDEDEIYSRVSCVGQFK